LSMSNEPSRAIASANLKSIKSVNQPVCGNAFQVVRRLEAVFSSRNAEK
jgi:hypothetical protein